MTYIIAPHPDDELIGCHSLIEREQVTGVAYFDYCNETRLDEASMLCSHYKLDMYCFDKSFEALILFIKRNLDQLILIPSPEDDHYLHKTIFYLCSTIRKREMKPFGVYSVYMNDWFIKEYHIPERKREKLNQFYPSQKSLWESDHKFFLFEGMVIHE